MPGERMDDRSDRRLRYEEIEDPQFQRAWLEARQLDGEQVDAAFRHGFDARDRFAERPFQEVEDYLRESWNGMGPPAPWDEAVGLIRAGYELYKGAGFGRSAESVDEALEHFPTEETIGGSIVGGRMGDRPILGAAEPVADFDGEGGPPVGGHELEMNESPERGPVKE